jgi:transcriptional regulator with XRE-family HTH domain
MFSKRLKELRLEKKLLQSQLATELNVDRTTIIKWESGQNQTDFATLIKIADFFDVSIDYLLGRKDY